MISSYNIEPQTVSHGQGVVFSINRILTGTTATHTEGSKTFQLNKPGYYYLSFNGVVDSKEGAAIQLYNNGTAVLGAVAASTGATEENLSFSTIIKVIPSCCQIDNTANLTFVNNGSDTTLVNANVVITKLC